MHFLGWRTGERQPGHHCFDFTKESLTRPAPYPAPPPPPHLQTCPPHPILPSISYPSSSVKKILPSLSSKYNSRQLTLLRVLQQQTTSGSGNPAVYASPTTDWIARSANVGSVRRKGGEHCKITLHQSSIFKFWSQAVNELDRSKSTWVVTVCASCSRCEC